MARDTRQCSAERLLNVRKKRIFIGHLASLHEKSPHNLGLGPDRKFSNYESPLSETIAVLL
jgi:hypothetical protein